MRVCLVVPYDLSIEGGVKKHAVCLAAALRRLGDQVELIGPASAPVDLPHTTTFGGVVSIQSNGSDNRLGLLTSPFQIRSYLRRRRFDVLHVHEPMNPILAFYATWWAAAHVKIATFHCFAERETFLRRLGRRAFAGQLRAFDRAIAVSEPAARYARVSWRRELSVISNGVDVSFFRPPLGKSVSKERRLLFVGNWTDQRKGLAVLLDAHRRLLGGGLDVHLDVVGRGTPNIPLPASTETVTYHGHLSEHDLRSRLHACDIFVSPALRSESFGMVLVEAMAAGKPVVCSDIEGYRQVAAGTGSRLVPPGDALALAQAIVPILRSAPLAANMAALNLAAATQYDWEAIATQVRAEYLAALMMVSSANLLPPLPRQATESRDISVSTFPR
jgi:phosphatidyl-myo-inositol alpha-mannosyltransferase